MEKLKQSMIDFAKEAGIHLLRDFRNIKDFSRRDQGKAIKTIYDLASDRLIKSFIEKNYPTHSLLTEETGYVKKDPSHLWIVDPLDGTGNFVNGNPFFSVSIALKIKNKIKIGVVYAPVLNELFIAEKNKGVLLNGRKIKVSEVKDLQKSYLVTCDGGEKNRNRKSNIYKTFTSKAIDFRKLGSAAIECSFVASGRADGYITTKISPWDVAAGVLIVEEAGGKISDFKGNKWKCENTDFIASNGKIHKYLLKETRNL